VTSRTEEGVVPLDAEEETFLRALARVLVTLPRVLEEDLLRDGRMSTSEYFVLVHLSEAASRRLRMSDLARAAALSLSGITRVVQRLEAAGLVRRERSPEDGRGWFAVLTPTGLARLEETWPAHLGSTRRRLFDHLAGVDLAPVTAALDAVVRSAVEGPCAAEDPGPCDGPPGGCG